MTYIIWYQWLKSSFQAHTVLISLNGRLPHGHYQCNFHCILADNVPLVLSAWMVNLLAVKMIVLIIVTSCYIVHFQYASFVSIHRDCLFLSYCGISMHIKSLQHIQWHTRLRLMCHFFVLTTFWRHLWSITEQTHDNLESIYLLNRACSLYNCLCELHPCTRYMGNYTKRTLSIWDISFHVYLYLNCRHISLKS